MEPDDSRHSTLRVDYHMHTCYSYDSGAPLEAVLEHARAARIGRLCVTDHDTIDGALRLVQMAGTELEIVIGCEFSTDDGSQIVGLYLPAMIGERRIPDLLDAIRSHGGKVLLPHPFRRGSGIFRREMRRSESFINEILAHTDLIECFNGRDSLENNSASYEFARDRGLRAVASSDAHSPDELGAVFVEYAADDAVDGVSQRQICFPDHIQRSENPAKRALMVRYHRYQRRLPAVIRSAYLSSRRRYLARRKVGRVSPTRMQYEFPAASRTVSDTK